MTQRSWIWLGFAVLLCAQSLTYFFETPHDTILWVSTVVFWAAAVLVFAPIVMAGLRNGLPGMRDEINRRSAPRPGVGYNADRVMLTALVVGMVAVTGDCVWLAYKG